MNIRLGIYDFFSRIAPGALYLFAFAQFVSIIGIYQFDWSILNDLGIVPALGLGLLAYFVGTAMDRASMRWHKIFKKGGMSKAQLKSFKEKFEDKWKFDFSDKEWPVLFAYIRLQNPDLASEIERNNALGIMLRNVSFGLLLMTINQVITFFTTFEYVYIALGVFFLFISIMLGGEAIRFSSWFYAEIFETSLALQLDLKKRIKQKKQAEEKDED